MCELTLDAFGYQPEEAALARRLHCLLHEQVVAQPLPVWLQRRQLFSLQVPGDGFTAVTGAAPRQASPPQRRSA